MGSYNMDIDDDLVHSEIEDLQQLKANVILSSFQFTYSMNRIYLKLSLLLIQIISFHIYHF